jgi:hypothetical protein
MPGLRADKLPLLKALVNREIERKVEASRLRDRRQKNAAVFLAILGLVVFSFINLSPALEGRPPIREFFVIVSWVLIWKAVEIFFFKRAATSRRKLRLLFLHGAEYRAGRAGGRLRPAAPASG